MTITEYIKNDPTLSKIVAEKKDASMYDIVSSSDIFAYDDIIDDEEFGPNTKVIYIDGDRERPWAIASILQIDNENDCEPDRRETWKKYISQYQFLSFKTSKEVAKDLNEAIK